MANRAGDWLAQAERDVEHARASQRDGRHEWACFAAHQAAEKAVKAVHLAQGQEAWGHVVAQLLRELPLEAPPELIDRARVLDNFYVPTRYPNGHPAGAPFEQRGARWDLSSLPVPADLLVYTESEWHAVTGRHDRFARMLDQEVVWIPGPAARPPAKMRPPS
jgi:HEPN domain-containing protein